MQLFAGTWMMPLIFVISGASLFYTVGKGSAGKFVKDKTLRLLVPLLVGDFTHASLQVYLERVTHGQFSGSYFQLIEARMQILMTIFANPFVQSATVTFNGDTIGNWGVSNSINAKPAEYVFTRSEVEAFITKNLYTTP